MTKMELADALFSRAGFIGRILPAIALHCAALLGVALFTLNRTAPETDPVGICVVVCCFIVIVDLIRYRIAAAKHRDLTMRLGQRYVELVNEGKVPLNANGVLLLGSPGTFAERLIEKEPPK